MYEVPEGEFAAHHARLVAHVVAGEITVDVERVPLEQLPRRGPARRTAPPESQGNSSPFRSDRVQVVSNPFAYRSSRRPAT